MPLGTDRGAWACDPETALDTQFIPQGIGADLIATIEEFSREDVDRFALGSQKKAAKAREAGLFKDSVVPVKDAIGDVILGEDEFIKAHTTMEGLASLKISFDQMGAMGYDWVAPRRYPPAARTTPLHTPAPHWFAGPWNRC